MRYRLARRVWAARQQRLFDGHARRALQDLGAVEIAAEAVEDPHPIRLVEGAQAPLPCHEPANVRQHPEVRPVPAHQRDLVGDRQNHRLRRSVPKKVFFGVGRATDGAATPVIKPLAGRFSRPAPGVC